MSTYVIGDVQGCYDELLNLLDIIKFNEAKDTLWFTGDLVNRGPKSLQVLRFVHRLPHVITVLGNHDLALLALAYTKQPIKHHNLHEILTAPDRDTLLMWLRQRPLLHEDSKSHSLLVHAGIPPQWSILQAKQYAKEVELYLQSENFKDLLDNMFGNEPSHWDPNLQSWERYRFIINGLTRLRFCDLRGNIDLTYKGNIDSAPSHLVPWFKFPLKEDGHKKILFGHWAAIEGQVDVPHVEALDTGCFWGGTLTALRLEDGIKFRFSCSAGKPVK